MRHPFDGINPPQASRRTWLGMLAAFFGAAAVRAAAPPGNRVVPGPSPEPPRATTEALGEEGGKPPMSTTAAFEEGASTRALGEEGGRPPIRLTEKLGEGGGPVPTTLAIGEEGGKKK
jgi:hypothetical protein